MALFATFMAGLVESFNPGTSDTVSGATSAVVFPTYVAGKASDTPAADDETAQAEPTSAADRILGPTVAPTSLAEIKAAQEAAARKKAEEEAKRKAEEEAKRKAEEEAAKEKAEEEARAEREAAEEREASRSVERAIANPKDAARAMIGDYGWGDDQFECLDLLWTRESNWDYQAQNPSSGAYGIPQSLPGSKMASVGDDWQTNPLTQITWGLGYIDERYGSPCSAWSHSESTGWY